MIKGLIRSLAKGVGLEVHRYVPARSYAAQLQTMLVAHGVDLILDVGANSGQFGSELRKHMGYKGRIVSFEPTLDAHNALISRANGDPNWIVAERCAIGAVEGLIDMNVSANSVSSSALPMLKSHEEAAPGSEYVSVERVPLHPLDVLAPSWLKDASSSFLKIDTQGFESEVIKGAAHTISQVNGLQLELSLTPLYAGQKLWLILIEEIVAMGFELWSIYPVFCDERTGQLLQIDATFFRQRVRSSEQ